jgi:putative acetyltransferase
MVQHRCGTAVTTLQFAEVTSADPEVDALLAAHVDLMRSQSPQDSCHVMTANDLRAAGARVFVGRDASGHAVAVGAIKPLPQGGAELKSMHCRAASRGQGFGRALLIHLIDEARAAGFTTLWLETGSQPPFAAARALYASHGFVTCPPFAGYVDDPLSTFMTRSV